MFAIANTDHDWFSHMREKSPGRVVNFWTPTPWRVKGLSEGSRLYFMLKAPIRRIGGYGTFIRYVEKTAAEAWEIYGRNNGVESQQALVSKVQEFAEKRSETFTPSTNPVLGCIELSNVVAMDDENFIDPADCGHSFPKEVVKLKYFDEADGFAARLGIDSKPVPFEIVEGGGSSHKSSLRKDRKGQSAFRQQVLRNYNYRCSILGECIVELLEAAHIQPYVDERSNHPQNGLCLRVDLHRLFDEGLISITERYTVKVSAKLASTFYATLEGKEISLPSDPSAHPSAEALAYKRTCFR